MGMDILDVNLRIEKAFQISIPHHCWEALLSRRVERRGWWIFQYEQGDATVGELCEAVNKTLREQGMPVPQDTFRRVKATLVETLGVPPSEIHPQALLSRDLGMD